MLLALTDILSFSPPMFAAFYALKEMLLVMGILILLCGFLFLLTILTRDGRSKRRRHRRRHRSSPDSSSEEAVKVKESAMAADGRRRRRKYRKRKKEHRPNNPTLAETGGLPEERPPGHENSSA